MMEKVITDHNDSTFVINDTLFISGKFKNYLGSTYDIFQDKSISAEQYLNDVQRQRDLERCGWVFWRIRESSFYHNKNQAL